MAIDTQKLLDGFKTAGRAITTLTQGQSDRNHIYTNKSTINLAIGAVTTTSGIFIQQATTERAGAMLAQQFIADGYVPYLFRRKR